MLRSLVEALLIRFGGLGLTGGFGRETLGKPDWLMSGVVVLTVGGWTRLFLLFLTYLLLPLLGFRGLYTGPEVWEEECGEPRD